MFEPAGTGQAGGTSSSLGACRGKSMRKTGGRVEGDGDATTTTKTTTKRRAITRGRGGSESRYDDAYFHTPDKVRNVSNDENSRIVESIAMSDEINTRNLSAYVVVLVYS